MHPINVFAPNWFRYIFKVVAIYILNHETKNENCNSKIVYFENKLQHILSQNSFKGANNIGLCKDWKSFCRKITFIQMKFWMKCIAICYKECQIFLLIIVE